VARGCINTPVTRRIHASFAETYDAGRALVSLTRFQTAEYDGLAPPKPEAKAGLSRQILPHRNDFLYSKIIFHAVK
jgi:hypothetical protein